MPLASIVPNMKTRLSVAIITLNEERNLAECLASVAFADEIVVVDGGSQDRTCEIARAAGARIIAATDWHGFGIQKNRAIDSPSHPTTPRGIASRCEKTFSGP